MNYPQIMSPVPFASKSGGWERRPWPACSLHMTVCSLYTIVCRLMQAAYRRSQVAGCIPSDGNMQPSGPRLWVVYTNALKRQKNKINCAFVLPFPSSSWHIPSSFRLVLNSILCRHCLDRASYRCSHAARA